MNAMTFRGREFSLTRKYALYTVYKYELFFSILEFLRLGRIRGEEMK